MDDPVAREGDVAVALVDMAPLVAVESDDEAGVLDERGRGHGDRF